MMTKSRNCVLRISVSRVYGRFQCEESAQAEAEIVARLERIRQGKEATDNG